MAQKKITGDQVLVNLNDLADVDIPSVNDGDVLTRVAGEWAAAAPSSGAAPLYEEITTDGIANSFTTTIPVAPKDARAYVQVFLNGVLQMEGLGLTVVAPNTLNFATLPGVGNHIAVFSHV